MDRRKLQRVVLPAGLLFFILFFILVALGDLLHTAGEAVKAEEQKKLGALVREHPEYEDSYARIMCGDAPDDASGLGERIMEKYGYEARDGGAYREVRRYLFLAGGLLVGGMTAACLAALLALRAQRRAEEERERLEEKLGELRLREEGTRERLIREEQETKSLVTDISHQLKTPIAALRMSLELKETTELTEEEKREFSGRELQEVAKLEELLHGFTQLSRLETDMIRICPRMEAIRETLAGAVGAVYMKAFRRGIGLSLEESRDRRIPHDPKWTREAFVNILDNAVKYSPEGTSVTVRMSYLGSAVMIEFEDQGIGVPQEEAHRIFQRFYRGSARQVQEGEGAGVGLYLARRILEAQGGTICVKRGRQGGSNFIVPLPYNSVMNSVSVL